VQTNASNSISLLLSKKAKVYFVFCVSYVSFVKQVICQERFTTPGTLFIYPVKTVSLQDILYMYSNYSVKNKVQNVSRYILHTYQSWTTEAFSIL
jgi:hypothetical protein